MHRGPRRKKPKNTNSLLASILVLPICGSMRTVGKLRHLKYLTDLVASWMREHGYRKITLEIFGAAIGPPKEYRVSLKADLD